MNTKKVKVVQVARTFIDAGKINNTLFILSMSMYSSSSYIAKEE